MTRILFKLVPEYTDSDVDSDADSDTESDTDVHLQTPARMRAGLTRITISDYYYPC